MNLTLFLFIFSFFNNVCYSAPTQTPNAVSNLDPINSEECAVCFMKKELKSGCFDCLKSNGNSFSHSFCLDCAIKVDPPICPMCRSDSTIDFYLKRLKKSFKDCGEDDACLILVLEQSLNWLHDKEGVESNPDVSSTIIDMIKQVKMISGQQFQNIFILCHFLDPNILEKLVENYLLHDNDDNDELTRNYLKISILTSFEHNTVHILEKFMEKLGNTYELKAFVIAYAIAGLFMNPDYKVLLFDFIEKYGHKSHYESYVLNALAHSVKYSKFKPLLPFVEKYGNISNNLFYLKYAIHYAIQFKKLDEIELYVFYFGQPSQSLFKVKLAISSCYFHSDSSQLVDFINRFGISHEYHDYIKYAIKAAIIKKTSHDSVLSTIILNYGEKEDCPKYIEYAQSQYTPENSQIVYSIISFIKSLLSV